MFAVAVSGQSLYKIKGKKQTRTEKMTIAKERRRSKKVTTGEEGGMRAGNITNIAN